MQLIIPRTIAEIYTAKCVAKYQLARDNLAPPLAPKNNAKTTHKFCIV